MYIKTGLRFARGANQDTVRLKLMYAACLRIAMCTPGDLAICIKTELRVARRANQEGDRLKGIC